MIALEIENIETIDERGNDKKRRCVVPRRIVIKQARRAVLPDNRAFGYIAPRRMVLISSDAGDKAPRAAGSFGGQDVFK